MTFKILRIFFLLAVMSTVALTSSAKMTDDQVIEYVKNAAAQGKSQQTIGRELLAQGVTKEQIQRIQSSQSKASSNNLSQAINVDRSKGDAKSTAVNGTIGSNTQYSTSDFNEVVINEQFMSSDEMAGTATMYSAATFSAAATSHSSPMKTSQRPVTTSSGLAMKS